MATLRSNRLILLSGLLLIGTLLLVAPDRSVGQEKKKISWVSKGENTKISAQQAFQIPDITGHVMRIAEFRRTWPDGGGPVVEGHKVVEEVVHGLADIIAGNGRGSGYSSWRFENGDVMFGEWHSTTQTVLNPDRSRKTTFIGTYVTTGGTGRFKSIKGLGRFIGAAELDAEGKTTRNELSADGEYWFEK